MEVPPVITNEIIRQIFELSIELFIERSQQLNWELLLKHIRENVTLRANASASAWTYFERVKARSHLTDEEFQLVTINALNILARCNPATSTNGLVYGEVQSGKTTSMIVLAALAFDLGFKSVVLLSGRINILRNQTQSRTQQSMQSEHPASPSPVNSRNTTPDNKNRKRKRDASEDDLIYDSDDTDIDTDEEIQDSPWMELGDALLERTDALDHVFWLTVDDKDVQNVIIDLDNLATSSKLFAVLKKVPKSLDCFTAFVKGEFDTSPWTKVRKNNPQFVSRQQEILQKLAAFKSGPALIIDDECDEASVANTQRQQQGIPPRMQAVRASWSENIAPCHYVGYSATPQANILNHVEDQFFPNFLWELSTESEFYLGSKMYVDETLRNRIIQTIPYDDFPNLNNEDIIMPGGEKRGLSAIQEEFLSKCLNTKNVSASLKKFLAYYVFTGAIRVQRNRPMIRGIEALIANCIGSVDPLRFFEPNDEMREKLRRKLLKKLQNQSGPISNLNYNQISEFFNNFDVRYSEMFCKPSFDHKLVVSILENLTKTRIVLYVTSDTGKFKEIDSGSNNNNRPVTYIAYYKNQFYQLLEP